MKTLRLLAFAGLSAAALAACTPTHNVRGNMLEDYQLTEVVPGVDSQTEVLRKFGSPTTKAPFNDNVWYYLGQETEKRGIMDPEILDERIVVVFFNSAGIVEKVEDVDNERVDLPYVRRKTPTSGNEITVLQQFFGNLGKFNKEEAPE